MKNIFSFRGLVFNVCCLFFLLSFNAFAQVGIGTTTPNANAKLDVTSTAVEPGGLLLPRVALSGTANVAPLTAHVQGMTVYNTATAGNVTPGYYYNDGTQWVRIAADFTPSDDWTTTGNSGTTPGTGTGQNYIGTGDNTNLIIATNDTERIRVRGNNGNVGIGSPGNPTQRLHVNGNLRLEGAFMPGNDAGTGNRVLTSAGTGASPVWGADMGNVNGIHRYVTSPGMDINAATNNSITVTVPGLTTGATAIVNIQGNWSAAIYDDITIHNIEVRTGEVRFSITNNTGLWGATNYPGMIFNVTVIR